MSPQPDENDNRSVLSWESVLDASDTDPTATPPSTAPRAAPSPAPPPAPHALTGTPESSASPAPPVGNDIELTIAPLSLDPLSLEPLARIPESQAPTTGTTPETTAVIGDLHLELPPLEVSSLAVPPLETSSLAVPPLETSSLELPPLELDVAELASAAAALPAPPASPLPPIDTTPIDTTPVDDRPGDVGTSESPVFEMIDLKIAPLDTPHRPLSGEIAAALASDSASPGPGPIANETPTPDPVTVDGAKPVASIQPAPAVQEPTPVAAPAEVPVVPVAPAPVVQAAPVPAPTPAVVTAPIRTQAPAPTQAPAVEAPAPARVAPTAAASAPAAETDVAAPAMAPGLPDDAVAEDATPTTVIAAVIHGQIAPPAIPGNDAGAQPITDVSVVSIPNLQPNQISQVAPAVSVSAPASKAEPAPAAAKVSRKDLAHQKKLKKHERKQALQAAKAKGKSQRSGGGIALFLTLLVLAGLIAGAIVFGKPYLFPDEWEDASRPYGEAVEAARGADFDEPLVVQRRAADAFAISMAEHVIGPWEADMAMWRSLGLVSGSVDADLLGNLVADWTPAYYSPITGEVIANDATPAAKLDPAITEAMAAAASDQESGWSSTINEVLLDASAVTRSAVTASSRASAGATTFGAADVAARDIGVSTFLPPVLEYRVNAADAYAEFAPENTTALEALAASSQLAVASEPQLVDGETLVASQQLTDRTFWYLVFASYTDAATAYAASNALVQSSLATSNAAGTQCTYGTFSGTDVGGTARVGDVLQQWTANAPAELNSSFTTLPDGAMQLRSCDPGVGATSAARFGVGREIARFRLVELAAISDLPVTAETPIDLAAVIDEVRASAIGLPMLDLGFDATPEQSAAQARAIVTAASSSTTPDAGD